MPPLLTRRFEARLADAPALTGFVEAQVLSLDRDTALKLRLMLEELFVNTVSHGHGGDCDAPVDVTIDVGAEHVAVTYLDSAPPFDPFSAVQEPDAEDSIDARPVGRLGVFLVTRLADRYEYACIDGRNRVKLHLRLRRPLTS